MMYATPNHSLPPKPVFDHNAANSAAAAAAAAGNVTPSAAGVTPSAIPAVGPVPLRTDVNYPFQYAFCVNLAIGTAPNRAEIIYATPKAEANWMHPPGCPIEKQQPKRLPFYQEVVRGLEDVCAEIRARGDGCAATVEVTDVDNSWMMQGGNPTFETQRPKRDISIGIWMGGPDTPSLLQMRNLILSRAPAQLRVANVDLDHGHYYCPHEDVRDQINRHLANIAAYCGVDIFLLKPEESKIVGDPEIDSTGNKRLRIKIFGDYESVEHAKTRILLMVDDMMGLKIHPVYVELSLHSLISGRNRKNIKMIEQQTRTAIYFPPPFPGVYSYTPKGAVRRHPDEIFISGHNKEDVAKAELALHALVGSIDFRRKIPTSEAYRERQSLQQRCYVKDTSLGFRKLDFLIMERMDELRTIIEQNGTYVQFPGLGTASMYLRVQGVETLHIERTIRAIMTLASQYYDSTWWIMNDQAALLNLSHPSPAEFRKVLIDVSAKSGTDVGFHKNFFEITGSDWAVRRALELINNFDYARCSQYQVRIKIELANEHKEFVAGKKNGKINKIMGQSNIHILFEGFNEYNFYIDVVGNKYDSVRLGLELVEQELPASMSFHVPDTYHKRIIGVGGQHIQTIMKKYSVFVKFSNAMERGAAGKVENEDQKVDNVICRTPARNAANLELVKAEIMEMVQQVDADITTETVEIPRLNHRDLMAQRNVLDDLEKQWGCTVSFPSTEQASDIVTIKGPEWQIPHFKEGLLALVPESHQIRLKWSPELEQILKDSRLKNDVVAPIRSRLYIDVVVQEAVPKNGSMVPEEQTIEFQYTRNDAGGLQDAIELLLNHLLSRGVKAELVEGRLTRPKSDSFEDFSPYFESAVLQKTSHDNLNRPGSRNSGDMDEEPSATERAFYNGDKRRTSVPENSGGPGSTGSAASSRASYHSRAASLDSTWEQVSAHHEP